MRVREREREDCERERDVRGGGGGEGSRHVLEAPPRPRLLPRAPFDDRVDLQSTASSDGRIVQATPEGG